MTHNGMQWNGHEFALCNQFTQNSQRHTIAKLIC